MRLFFALWPPPKTAHALARWARQMQGTPTAEENIHLTLAFLGEAEPGPAHNAARRVQAHRQALPIEAVRYVKRNKMVWVGPREMPPALADLVARLHKSLREASFTLDDRPFAAHVTLLRRAPPPPALPPLPQLEWPVDEFLLVRSRASPRGSTYEPLGRYSLA